MSYELLGLGAAAPPPAPRPPAHLAAGAAYLLADAAEKLGTASALPFVAAGVFFTRKSGVLGMLLGAVGGAAVGGAAYCGLMKAAGRTCL